MPIIVQNKIIAVAALLIIIAANAVIWFDRPTAVAAYPDEVFPNRDAKAVNAAPSSKDKKAPAKPKAKVAQKKQAVPSPGDADETDGD